MDCSICLEQTQFGKCGAKPKGSNDVRLKCKHVFHRNCIKKWFIENDTCPICRDCMRFKEGGYFKFLMHLFCLRKIIVIINHNLFYEDNFIYHDNAMLVLFINYIKQNLLHFSNLRWYLHTDIMYLYHTT